MFDKTNYTNLHISAYMEIGTTNISALIGPHVEALATATEKFGLPYFLTNNPSESERYRPANVISVLPNPLDVMLVAAEVARRYRWREMGFIYDNSKGINQPSPQYRHVYSSHYL